MARVCFDRVLHLVLKVMVWTSIAFLSIILLIALSALEIGLLNRLGVPQQFSYLALVFTWAVSFYVGFRRGNIIGPATIDVGDLVAAVGVVAAIYVAVATLQEQQRFEMRMRAIEIPTMTAVAQNLPESLKDRYVEDFDGFIEFFDPEPLKLQKFAAFLVLENTSHTADATEVRMRVRVDGVGAVYGLACLLCEEEPQCETRQLAKAGEIPTEALCVFEMIQREARYRLVVGLASKPNAKSPRIIVSGGSANRGQIEFRDERR